MGNIFFPRDDFNSPRWSRSVFALFPTLNIFIAVELGGERGWLSACLGQGENHRQKSHVWKSDGNAIFGT